jgi:catechol 2,3-dioxygenase-like lactoylglutathione lyase family enzyme
MLSIDHVALPCFDLAATEAFYGGCLELPVAGTFEGTSALWAGRRFTYLAFGLAGGALLDFFAIEGIARREGDPVPAGARHVALGVGSRAELARLRARLEAAGVWVSGEVPHAEGRLSLYCFDPSGHQVELTHRAASPA